MPVDHRFDSNIVVIEMVGEYSLDEVRKSILHALADAQCPASPCVLVDLSNSRSILKRSAADIRSLARSLAPLSKRFNDRIALVAPSDLAYGLMRMGSAFSEENGYTPEVFRTVDEARNWLLL